MKERKKESLHSYGISVKSPETVPALASHCNDRLPLNVGHTPEAERGEKGDNKSTAGLNVCTDGPLCAHATCEKTPVRHVSGARRPLSSFYLSFPCLLLKKETERMRRAQMCNYTTRLRRSDKFNPAPELLKHLFRTAPADVTNR